MEAPGTFLPVPPRPSRRPLRGLLRMRGFVVCFQQEHLILRSARKGASRKMKLPRRLTQSINLFRAAFYNATKNVVPKTHGVRSWT